MRLTILGTRGEIEQTAPYHSRHSGLLIDETLMVDVGEREFLDRAPQAVLITHLHPDHAYFVRAGEERPPAGIPIFAPEGYKDYGLTVLDEPRTIAGYGVQPVPSHHSLKVRSQAYIIAQGSTKILYTGDMGSLDERGLHFAGRASLIIKPAGHQVFPGDIESHICALEDKVASCAVVGVEHPLLSEAIVAFVEKKPGAELAVPELRRHAKGMASYMRPLHYVLLEPGQMPLNRAAKSDYIRLREMAGEAAKKLGWQAGA